MTFIVTASVLLVVIICVLLVFAALFIWNRKRNRKVVTDNESGEDPLGGDRSRNIETVKQDESGSGAGRMG